jgi:hypothetical protein
MVEHALCAADPKRSLTDNYEQRVTYAYFDKQRERQLAHARVCCPGGLSPHDEFYLWGLLALTLAQPEADGQLVATPHFCLRRLGVIDQHSKRGGRQYRQFEHVLERLAAVTYQNDAFYDPLRSEHRRVSFGFFSYSLPLDLASGRSWRIVWNPLFWELAQATGGHLRFDLDTYRELSIVARRMFLLLAKLFYRRRESPKFELRDLAVNVLGLAGSQDLRNLKDRVTRVLEELADIEVVVLDGAPFTKLRSGHYVLSVQRGPYFERRRPRLRRALRDCAHFEPLVGLGFDETGAERLLRRYSHAIVREWIDITMAAQERHGKEFFKRSPAAYLTDNVKQAAKGKRTPPDWWHELRKEEDRRRAVQHRSGQSADDRLDNADDLVTQMTRHFLAAGQPESLARANAQRCGNSLKKDHPS